MRTGHVISTRVRAPCDDARRGCAPEATCPPGARARGAGRSGRRLRLAVIWALLGAVPVWAATTRYVDGTAGDDRFDGLAAVPGDGHGPKATIQAAVDSSAAGDTVVVLPGLYPEAVRFRGAEITLRGADPGSPESIAATVICGDPALPWARVGVVFENGEGVGAVLSGLTIATGTGRGIECRNGSSPTLVGLVVRGNAGSAQCPGGGIACVDSSPLIRNCLVAGNASAWGCAGISLVRSSPQIVHCTIAGNTGTATPDAAGGGVACTGASNPVIRHCILWGNRDNADPACPQILVRDESSPAIAYSCVQGGRAGTPGAVWLPGSFDADPLFAEAAAGDFRLLSAGGRWTGEDWVSDTVTSPCIDAGDPADEASAEPAPNGGRVNLGFDGNTPFASRSPAVHPGLTATPASATVPEGGTAVLRVSLSGAVPQPVTVAVFVDPPVPGLAVAGPATWTLGGDGAPAACDVTLAAAEDDADAENAAASLWVECTGYAPVRVPVTVEDDDVALTVIGGTPRGTTVHERGAVVSVAAQSPPHWHFTGWEADGPGLADAARAETTVTLTRSLTLTARFAVDRHSLAVISPMGDPQGAGVYEYGAVAAWSVTSPVEGGPGRRFVAHPAAGTVFMDADRVVAVDWRTEYLLTTDALGPGTVRPEGSSWYRDGRTVTLTALPEPGCQFVGWQGDVPPANTLDNPLALTMDRPRAAQACFSRTGASSWAAVTVNRSARPGAGARWVEVRRDRAGGWQSDLSIVAPPHGPPVLVASFRAWPHGQPGEAVGGGFEADLPGRLPGGWQFAPAWPAEHCLVASLDPPAGQIARALRLVGTDDAPQGLVLPRSVVPSGAVDAEVVLRLPESVPPETSLAEFWVQGVGLRLGTDADGLIRIALVKGHAAHALSLEPTLEPGRWATLSLFLWDRIDVDDDGLDDGWERACFGDLTRTAADDPDQDGLPLRDEYALGTDPARADTDGDGMPDGWEQTRGLDPLTGDAEADPDTDLIPNRLEAVLGTLPRLPDAPWPLFAALWRLAAFWPMAEDFQDRCPGALPLMPRGEAVIAGGTLVLQGAGGAECQDIPAALGAAPGRTLSLWFRSTGGGPLLTATCSPGEPDALALVQDPAGVLAATVRGADVSGAPAAWSAAGAAEQGSWHHAVVVCPDIGQPALYLDGGLIAAEPRGAGEQAMVQSASWGSLLVGMTRPDAAPGTSFRGEILALALFTGALPAAAVDDLWRAGREVPLAAIAALDLDADGMPDAWECRHFGDLGQLPQDDPDADGLANLDEYRLRCDPANPDSDGDRLADGAEVHTYRTDPLKPDTDGDGLTDGDEVQRTDSDPLQQDTDGDGLPDGWEIELQLSPVKADTNGDGVPDGLADTDGDGIPNSRELARGTNPAQLDPDGPAVSFAVASTPVVEADAVVRVTLEFSGQLSPGETVSLRVAVAGGTASPGSDFEYAETALEFTPGVTSAAVEVRLRADEVPEPQETIVLAIAGLRGARLGPHPTHTLLVADALSPAADTDGDGLPDSWEMRFFGSLAENASGDPDRDGMSNLEEYRCGARPDKPYRVATPAEVGLRVTGFSP